MTSEDPRPNQRRRMLDLLGVLVLTSVLGAGGIVLGLRLASSAVVDLGPTDSRYAVDFRDVERDGPDYFRWSSVPSSRVNIPLRFCGPGAVRMRARRHFVDPATLTVSLAGSVIGQRSIYARGEQPYEILEFPVSKAICDSNASLLLESEVRNARPLGVAVDWVEFRSTEGFTASPTTILRGAAIMSLIGVFFWTAGGTLSLILGVCGTVAGLMTFGLARAPVAGESMIHGGLIAIVLTIALQTLGAGLVGTLGLAAGRWRVALSLLTLITLMSRLAFLHPQAFYPDYRVHALVQQTLNSKGLVGFMDDLFAIQYARSLGLQQIDGNWYPFPYPPGSYVLTGGVGSLFGLNPLEASIVTAAVLAASIPALTVGLGLAAGLGEAVSLLGAFYVAAHPLLVRRMALGYFPGVAGQFADAAALLLLLTVLRVKGGSSRRVLLLFLALAGAFLVYTQSVANFGILVAGTLVVEALRPSSKGRRAVWSIALASSVALGASVGAFYWRYLPVMENISTRQPQPESRVLERLDGLRRNAAIDAVTGDADDINDPFAGPNLNPARGVARLGSRLWRFNGPFVLALAIGAWSLWRSVDRSTQNLGLAWAGVALCISLLAAGLPSPNGFQHLKDLEFTAPLMALALAAATFRLWAWRPVVGVGVACAWVVFVGVAFRAEFKERLLILAGF